MAGQVFRVKFAREGQEFEVEGDRKFVLAMLERFGVPGGALTSESPKPVGRSAPQQKTSGKVLSAGEFVRQLNLKKHTDIVLAFGYYLEQYGGTREFTAADLNNCYYEAKMEASNTSQAIVQNIKRGLMMPARSSGAGKKRYVVTTSGEDFIKKKSTRQSE